MSTIPPIDLADIYGNAGLEADPNQFPSRRAVVAELVKSSDVATNKDLAAIAFGLPADDLTGRIVSLVRAADGSFSTKANARELKILAVGALEALTDDDLGWTDGMHAVLALSACGERECEVDSGIVTRMEGRRLQIAVTQANFLPSDALRPPKLKLDRLKAELEGLVPLLPQADDSTKVALDGVFKAFSDAIDAQNASLSTTIRSRLASINEKFSSQQSELELLWWLFGGWSSALEAPFETFDAPARALLIGVDLGRISNDEAGPAAVSTFAERAMGTCQEAEGTASLREVVGALELEQIGRLGLSDLSISDVSAFPILGLLGRRHDRDCSADEESLYKGVEQIDVDKKKPLLQWAKHIYHEMILARNLRDETDNRD